ncbi:MAG: hypothetical protein CMR00_01840 [[Chlorobium] sp. 445]|nr:MAG: hypothetical protein CMR00_01840 [[Chlorobium] sp. 445]
MKFLSLALFLVGATGAVFGSLKYRQQTEWEHWAAKLTWLSFLGFSVVIAGVGVVIFFVV